MKIAIFGATGRTGLPLLRQALDAGYEVIALVRDPAKMPVQHERLVLVKGDALNAADVEQAIKDCEAVISVLGHRKDSPKDMQVVAIRHIIAAMRKFGVKRLVCLTGAGVDMPEDRPKFMNHAIKLALKIMSPDILRDAQQYVAAIRASDLDWVIVRGPMLNDGPHTGKYRVGWVGVNTGPRISRADLADFMLKQITDDTYLRKAPMVSD